MTSPSDDTEAFLERFDLPPTRSGPLDGLTFAIKDIIDVAGRVTGCGNPTWAATHPPAASHALCVELLLAAGARGVGKTITDQLAFSLLGENHFFGTPLNPKAPDRVPGGSSSGSASAVAAGACDFALGSDTGGSVRFPASNCGLFGIRPTLNRITLAGVMPLAATFDTVGVFARDIDVFCRSAGVLLAGEVNGEAGPGTVHFLTEGFDLADAEVRDALAESVVRIRGSLGGRDTTITDAVGPTRGPGLRDFADVYRTLMPAEAWRSLGTWVETNSPELGPQMDETMAMARDTDPLRVVEAASRREELAARLDRFLGPFDVICMPTSPTLAPKKRSVTRRGGGDDGYYPRSLGYTAIAGVGRLPQVSLPLGNADGVPIGLSLIGAKDSDLWLLGLSRRIMDLFI